MKLRIFTKFSNLNWSSMVCFFLSGNVCKINVVLPKFSTYPLNKLQTGRQYKAPRVVKDIDFLLVFCLTMTTTKQELKLNKLIS